jgi:DNA polymerase-3 subunit alpha
MQIPASIFVNFVWLDFFGFSRSIMPAFTHLHVHTQFSILDGASKIGALVEKAESTGMKALAITDHGNMFGVPLFMQAARKKGIKPIVGC